jgi:hypothetical protein
MDDCRMRSMSRLSGVFTGPNKVGDVREVSSGRKAHNQCSKQCCRCRCALELVDRQAYGAADNRAWLEQSLAQGDFQSQNTIKTAGIASLQGSKPYRKCPEAPSGCGSFEGVMDDG